MTVYFCKNACNRVHMLNDASMKHSYYKHYIRIVNTAIVWADKSHKTKLKFLEPLILLGVAHLSKNKAASTFDSSNLLLKLWLEIMIPDDRSDQFLFIDTSY